MQRAIYVLATPITVGIWEMNQQMRAQTFHFSNKYIKHFFKVSSSFVAQDVEILAQDRNFLRTFKGSQKFL